ncbi:MAG: hypothetical protein AB7O37_14895 [Vicinamibacteria bacterium]
MLEAAGPASCGRSRETDAYLASLTGRLGLVERLLAAETEPAADELRRLAGESRLTRRVLRRIEGAWHDGDENRVRGHLDRFVRAGESRTRAALAGARAAASDLVSGEAGPGAVRFLLFALESAFAGLAETPPDAP